MAPRNNLSQLRVHTCTYAHVLSSALCAVLSRRRDSSRLAAWRKAAAHVVFQKHAIILHCNNPAVIRQKQVPGVDSTA